MRAYAMNTFKDAVLFFWNILRNSLKNWVCWWQTMPVLK